MLVPLLECSASHQKKTDSSSCIRPRNSSSSQTRSYQGSPPSWPIDLCCIALEWKSHVKLEQANWVRARRVINTIHQLEADQVKLSQPCNQHTATIVHFEQLRMKYQCMYRVTMIISSNKHDSSLIGSSVCHHTNSLTVYYWSRSVLPLRVTLTDLKKQITNVI